MPKPILEKQSETSRALWPLPCGAGASAKPGRLASTSPTPRVAPLRWSRRRACQLGLRVPGFRPQRSAVDTCPLSKVNRVLVPLALVGVGRRVAESDANDPAHVQDTPREKHPKRILPHDVVMISLLTTSVLWLPNALNIREVVSMTSASSALGRFAALPGTDASLWMCCLAHPVEFAALHPPR